MLTPDFDVAHVGDVDAAGAIDGDAVGPEELVRSFAGEGVADAVQELSVRIEDRYAMAEVLDAELDLRRALFGDVDAAVLAVDPNGDGLVDVPLADVLAVEREDLDAVVLTVADDDVVVIEDGDVVREAEEAVVGA